jgi:hypothetical protein
MPFRVQLSRRKGWRMPENSVKVDRSTPWGNPFIPGRDGSRADCIALYRRLLADPTAVATGPAKEALLAKHRYVSEHVRELRGRNLACWCSLPEPGGQDLCHAAVLLELANAE